MGFALWTDAELAWAAGTSEYRAMGAAVVSITDLFRAADFRANRRPPASSLTFAGHFASLGQMNAYLMKARRPARASSKKTGRASRPAGKRAPQGTLRAWGHGQEGKEHGQAKACPTRDTSGVRNGDWF